VWKDTASQLDQLAVVPEQDQLPHTRLARGHDHRPQPVAGLEQQLRRQAQPRRQIQAVLADHHHQISAETGCGGTLTQLGQASLQLVGGGTALNDGLGANQGQAIHHTEGRVAGALGEPAPLGKDDPQPQALAVGPERPQVHVQQLTGVVGEAKLGTASLASPPIDTPRVHTDAFACLQPQPLACALPGGRFAGRPGARPHPDGQIAGEIKPLAGLATADAQGRSPSRRAAASTGTGRNPGGSSNSSSGAGSSGPAA